VTFGCKANQYDTQVLREALQRRGWSEGREGGDLVVINTCTVTAEAGRKAKRLIRRLYREDPTRPIAVTGCLAEDEPALLRDMPGVRWVLGNGEAKRPVHFLRALGLDVDPEEMGIPAGITAFSGHTRAFLKIQDGCDQACAFCIIPRVRGASRSRPAAELVAEVQRLLGAGHREIVLCGIHIGHWGRDLGGKRPPDLGFLLETLAGVEQLDAEGRGIPWRLRLSSIEATEAVGSVVAAMAAHPVRIAPHLHMPLQSGDDGILKAMNRWYGRDTYLRCCDEIRSSLDEPAFTADILVGFPGEDEAAFENTLDAVARARFTRVHAFPFSARPGTVAAEMGPPPPVQIVRERRARLGDVAHATSLAFRSGLEGKRDAVVLEGTSGLSGRYERVRLVATPGAALRQGELLQVRLHLEDEGGAGEGQEQSGPSLVGLPVVDHAMSGAASG